MEEVFFFFFFSFPFWSQNKISYFKFFLILDEITIIYYYHILIRGGMDGHRVDSSLHSITSNLFHIDIGYKYKQ
jgi:hypothetical protein